MITFLVFLLGVCLGVAVNYRWGKRQSDGGQFADDEDTQALQFEAAAVVTERIQKRKDRIIEKTLEKGRITNDDVEDLYCIGDRTASSYLNQLVKEGRLKKRGAGRGTYYTLSSES